MTVHDEVFTDPEAIALAGFLAGYSGLARTAYALDLRIYAEWIAGHGVRLFDAKRVHIEAFARDLESLGRARATIARRPGTIACFYRYAEEEGLIEHSPAVLVRRPRLDYGSHAIGLDRNELGAMLVAAGRHRSHARAAERPHGAPTSLRHEVDRPAARVSRHVSVHPRRVSSVGRALDL
jgi:site-specific recombinase XerD